MNVFYRLLIGLLVAFALLVVLSLLGLSMGTPEVVIVTVLAVAGSVLVGNRRRKVSV